ncbi:MAG TPA: response regulator [Anaerolineae bacterium]|nr:response regulator [Anaerolineae bacterium]
MKHDATILVVDDNEDGRRILQSLLKAQGYRVYLAADGYEALEQAERTMPDLILLDVMMPGIDGFEVCRRLRTNPRLAEVPVVMVTALDDRPAKLQGIESGADDFVVKPFDPVELTARVRSITRLNRYRRLLLERTKFNWVVKQADDGYIELGDDDRVIYANPQARRFLDLPLDESDDEIIDTPFLALVQTQYNCEPQQLWANWPDPDHILDPRYLVRPETPHSRALWLQVDLIKSSSSLGDRYLIRLRDVSNEVKVQRNQWTFHAQVSHKLKTPLSLMTGFLTLLQEDLDTTALTGMQKDLFDRVFRSAMRLQEEIVGIFDYMESPDMLTPSQGVTPFSHLPATLRTISENFKLITLHINKENIPEQKFDLAISTKALELILWELVENAQKFHPERSPTVDVNLSWVENNNQPLLCLKVVDNGVNLPPEQLARIWMPYYQAEKYFTGQVKGMGLGLSMVASFIWEIGGRYRMYNRDNGPGAIVELHIPVHKKGDA